MAERGEASRSRRRDGDGRRVHLDAGGHGGLRRRPRGGGHPPLPGVMLPPLAAALMKFSQEYEYSWHTPGHTGGTAFLKSPVGRIFFDYFGENLLRSDLSISVGAWARCSTTPARSASTRSTRPGSSAPTAPTASPTARPCRTGSSSWPRWPRPDRALRPELPQVDRAQPGDDRAGSRSTWFPAQPLRDHRADPAGTLKAAALKAAIKANPLVTKGIETRPVYSVVTNSTYDGLCYNARRVRSCSTPASTASTSTRPGTPTRASTRSTATATRCTATPRTTRARRSSRRTRRTSCWRRCPRPRSCTSATAAARSRTRDSTNRS